MKDCIRIEKGRNKKISTQKRSEGRAGKKERKWVQLLDLKGGKGRKGGCTLGIDSGKGRKEGGSGIQDREEDSIEGVWGRGIFPYASLFIQFLTNQQMKAR